MQHVDDSGVRTVAGGAQPGFSGDGGPATAALLEQPTSIAYDAAGNLFITELGSRIRRVDAQTGRISTFAGVGGQDFGGDGGPATAARLNRPHGLAVAARRNRLLLRHVQQPHPQGRAGRDDLDGRDRAQPAGAT